MQAVIRHWVSPDGRDCGEFVHLPGNIAGNWLQIYAYEYKVESFR